MKRAILCVLLALLTLADLPAQNCKGGSAEKLLQLDGFRARDEFGYSAAAAGDVNGDGYDDIIVGARNARPLGAAYVFSGATGAMLYQYGGDASSDQFGTSVSGAGDVDGDGFGDFLIGAPNAQPGGFIDAGSVFLYSGATGTLIRRFSGLSGDFLGRSVSGAGDVDGDGIADVIFGAPGAGLYGMVYVYSVATSTFLHQFSGRSHGSAFGWAVSSAGDVNRDGHDDLIIGSPEAGWAKGEAEVFSGATGTLLRRFSGQHGNGRLGLSVSGVGDVDGDGLDDVLIGAPGEHFMGYPDVGSAYLLSVLSGVQIRHFHGEADWDEFGHSVAGGGDVDGDGIGDFVVGAPLAEALGRPNAGAAYVYSGATGARIGAFHGGGADVGRGHAVAITGDISGDGRADVLISDLSGHSWHSMWAGTASVVAVFPFLTVDAAHLSASAGGRVTFHLDFPDSEAGASYALLASLSGVGKWEVPGGCIPLFRDPFTQRMMTRPPAIMFNTIGTLGTGGVADAWVDAPPGPLSYWSGQRAWFSAVTHEPLGIRCASSAIPIDILP